VACLSTEELALLHDCTLPREVADRMREHLAACPRCAGEIALLGRLEAECLPVEALPKGLLDRLIALSDPGQEKSAVESVQAEHTVAEADPPVGRRIYK
jgi:hypothetical protein